METEYTELEKKIITNGIKSFRRELEDASKPMIKVLKKYGVRNQDPILRSITLRLPYGSDDYADCAVNIPNDAELKSLHSKILDLFMNDIKELKDKMQQIDL